MCRRFDPCPVHKVYFVKFMDIEIRRNRDLSFTMGGDSNREAFEKLLGMISPLTEEQKMLIDEGARVRRELEDMIWAYLVKEEIHDLSGNPVTRVTHEIGFDVKIEKHCGMDYAMAENVYVRPKKSEYEK